MQLGLKYADGNVSQFLTNLPRMIDLLREEFNRELLDQNIVSYMWIQIVEKLYCELDFEQTDFSGLGCLSQDRLQFFLFALLLNEINDENW